MSSTNDSDVIDLGQVRQRRKAKAAGWADANLKIALEHDETHVFLVVESASHAIRVPLAPSIALRFAVSMVRLATQLGGRP